jgi:hypothetical protein
VILPSDDDEFDVDSPIIYLQDEGVFGIIVSYGAYFSRVRYFKDGISYDVLVENEDMNGD